MDDSKIRQIVREELARSNGASRFAINNIPYHTHNGVDSPFTVNPTVVYTGYVPFNGDLNVYPFVFFPTGWRIEMQTSTLYRIYHNLNTPFYSVTACQSGPDGDQSGLAPITINQNDFFEIFWVRGGLILPTDFHFQLVQVNNKSVGNPTYNVFGT